MGVLPARPEGPARPRPQGRRAPGAARADRRRAAARDRDARWTGCASELVKGGVTGVDRRPRSSPTAFRVDGVPADAGRAGARRRRPPSRRTYNRESGVERHLHVPDEAEHRQPAARGDGRPGASGPSSAASTSSAWPSRSSRARARDQILVQLPGVTDVARAKEIIRSTALLELKLVEQGPSAREALLAGRTAPCRPTPRSLPGVAGARRRGQAGVVYYLVRKMPVVTGRDLRNAATQPRREQPAGGAVLAEAGRRHASSATAPARTSAVSSRSSSTTASQSAPVIEGRITDEGRIAGNFTQQEAADLSLMLRSGALPASLTYLEERTVGPSLGADSIRAGIMASLVGLALVVALHARLLQAGGHQRDRRDGGQPDRPAGADGLLRRDDDAAGHRRLHPDDRHGRRLERADLRAHQGRAAGRQGRAGGGRRRASTASSSRFSTPTSRRSSPPRSCSSSAPARSAASRRR